MPTKLNQPNLNNNKHKFRKRMVQISNSFAGSSKAHSLRALAPLGIVACSALGALNVSALSISVPQTIGFDIISGKASHSEVATIEVLSDDALAGYTLTLSGSETLNASKTENGSLGATTKENISDENEFDNNTWGLKYCNFSDNSDCIVSTNYTQPAETLQIDKTVVNSSQPVKYALSIGAKTSGSINADIYSSTFTLAATTNPVYHSVGFVDWTENMPDAIAGTGTTIKMPTNTPTKPGYTFTGWCKTKPAANGTVCYDFAEADGEGNYDLTANEGVAYTNLYAMWRYNANCVDFDASIVRDLQDVGTWGECVSVGMQITAKDTRDDKTYKVARLSDGKIWFLDNLALEQTENDLSSADTNVPAGWTGFSDGTRKLPTAEESVGRFDGNSENSYMLPGIFTEGMDHTRLKNATTLRDDNTDADNWKYGVLYNYCAATAGTICAESNSSEVIWVAAEGDICPAGWRLPMGDYENSEFRALLKIVTGTDVNSSDALVVNTFRKTLHIPFAGNIVEDTTHDYGLIGSFWGNRVSKSSEAAYRARVKNSNLEVLSTYTMERYYGISVRCVAK